MAKDLTITLENTPGTLATLGETLGKAGVNLEGICGIPTDGQGLVHILVDDTATARQTLTSAGFEVGDETEVLILDVEDTPGALGAVARRIADAGVNINLTYLATRTRIVVGADDLDKARLAI